jgi:hypothetical protein
MCNHDPTESAGKSVLEGGTMFRNLDDQTWKTNGRPVSLMHQLLGVLGEEEYFARQEAERRRKLAETQQAQFLRTSPANRVECRQRLGGLLRYYARTA